MQLLAFQLMIWMLVLVKNGSGVRCEFCNREFMHIKKHTWRCKNRVDREDNNDQQEFGSTRAETQRESISLDHSAVNIEIGNNTEGHNIAEANDKCSDHPTFQCYCGRYFTSLRGLNIHRRSCFIVNQPELKDMFSNSEHISEPEPDPNIIPVEEFLCKVDLKPGVKLPKNDKEWEIANVYFQLNLDLNTEITDVELEIQQFNKIVYDYFNSNYGLAKTRSDNDSTLYKKYKDCSKHTLKRHLRVLKHNHPENLEEIKFVSRLLRSKLKKTEKTQFLDHNKKIKRNFWKYCEEIFEQTNSVAPEFNENTCYQYFKNTCTENYPSRLFPFPSWLKKFSEPTSEFNLNPPTYREIRNIITKMKSGSCPCPLDQISVIALKKCPILRTQIWRICSYCWENKCFPSEWKNSATILIFKKGSTKDPSNFRPITLVPVLSKIMTSLLRNRIYSFALTNGYIESNIQKGFWSGVSGTIEHTELLTHIMKHAKLKQRQLVITLFDLKNAFGEVHHNLIKQVLLFHHIPEHIIALINNLYKNYYISIITKNYQTNPIKVGRGVLQGDCLSPLLFNLCMNTLLESIKSDKVKCLGYCYYESLSPRHWFQFADDTAIVTALQEDNQLLCNVFTKWTTWANFIIRIDKCHTFGIKKTSTASVQYEPMVLVRNERIPPTKDGCSFVYLGKQFNFGNNIQNIKTQLEELINKYLSTIDQLPLHVMNKMAIIQQYVYSKLRWEFSIYDLTETWVSQNIDNKIGNFLRKWCQLPVSANIQHMSLPKHHLGMNFIFAKTVYNKCKLTVRRILRLSKNSEVRKLYHLSSQKNVSTDSLINEVIVSTSEIPSKRIKNKLNTKFSNKENQNIWKKFMGLNEQNCLIKHLVSVCTYKTISMWQSLATTLPNNIFCFCRKALLLCLPNKSNLKRWNLCDSNHCMWCGKMETQLHVLSNCSSCLDRYKWRHDSVMKAILNKISRSRIKQLKIFADCENLSFECPSKLFANLRPDIVIQLNNNYYVLELTICFETNTVKSRDYKAHRYRDLQDDLIEPCSNFTLVLLEFTTLGFISKQSLESFKNLLTVLDVEENRTLIKCMETSIRASYYIFCRRYKPWLDNMELLNFY